MLILVDLFFFEKTMGGEREKGKLCPGQPGGAVMGPSYDYLIFFAFSGEKKQTTAPPLKKTNKKPTTNNKTHQ